MKSIKGREVNFDALIKENEYDIALGNASMNARGDIVKNGVVVETLEERRQKYYQLNPLSNEAEVNLNIQEEKQEEAVKALEEVVKERQEQKKEEKEVSEKIQFDKDFNKKIKKSEQIVFEE